MMRLLSITTLIILMSGCKVGPNYHTPLTKVPSAYGEDLPDQTFEVKDDDLVQWWSRFNDPFLDSLMQRTVDGNFDFHIALERVFQARAQYWVQFTQILPEVDVDGTASRFRTSQTFPAPIIAAPVTPLSPYQNFFQTGFDVIWELDIWGKFRRSAESAYDLWQASTDDARGVKITVLSEVAKIYTAICALQQKMIIADQAIKLDEELLSLSEERLISGLSNQQEVEAARAILNTDRAARKVLQILFKQNVYSLSVLLGEFPENIICDFEVERAIPLATGKIPAGIPSELLRRRPDIRSAERQLASATELIGVAVADLFPSLHLTGSSSSFAANPLQGANIGFSSGFADKLFTAPSKIWGIGGLIVWPILDFGKRQSVIDTQVALRNQAYLTYQKTVITALEEVESALASYFIEEQRLKDLTLAMESSQRSLDLAKDLYQAGLENYTQVLQAEEIWLNAVNSFTESQQSLTTDLIAVYKALGGEW